MTEIVIPIDEPLTDTWAFFENDECYEFDLLRPNKILPDGTRMWMVKNTGDEYDRHLLMADDWAGWYILKDRYWWSDDDDIPLPDDINDYRLVNRERVSVHYPPQVVVVDIATGNIRAANDAVEHQTIFGRDLTAEVIEWINDNPMGYDATEDEWIMLFKLRWV